MPWRQTIKKSKERNWSTAETQRLVLSSSSEEAVRGGAADKRSLNNVEHATKTQLVVDGIRFNREKGTSVGDNWNICWIEMPTEKRLAELKKEQKLDKATSLAEKIEKIVRRIQSNRCDSIDDIDVFIAAEEKFLEVLENTKN